MKLTVVRIDMTFGGNSGLGIRVAKKRRKFSLKSKVLSPSSMTKRGPKTLKDFLYWLELIILAWKKRNVAGNI